MTALRGIRVGCRAAALFAIALLLLMNAPATGQAPADGVPLLGRVVLEGEGVPGSRVTLHRVSAQQSGEVDTAVTDQAGAFRFTLQPAPPGEFTVYFATADHLSVRYFGRPIHPSEAGEEYLVAVYDTVYTAPEPIRIVRRDMVLMSDLTGGWDVNEAIQIYNPANAAVVGASGAPSWEFRIPRDATDFEAAEAEILPHEIAHMGDRVMLVTPVTPGSRTLVIRYRLPPGPATADIPIGEPTDTFNMFVRLPSHLTNVTGLEARQIFDVDEEQFVQYGALALTAGSGVRIQWGRAMGAPVDPVHAAVAATLLLLALALFAAFRNRRPAV